ncbi:hypothetical protein BU23DRAFT_565414 [Bimuria novae-zelandiae CBS 107.79]|uniref:Uncharacterized protein n=1 Tax=Bimuria novae-zelandiae CBS 107.79 TaxID=1447943 RepID=A0A6A5VP80_9PLEO|nr:hypothetical protein BU23DRAFT_565414 [Bimuria novae-zelandiae CBS 107.79]
MSDQASNKVRDAHRSNYRTMPQAFGDLIRPVFLNLARFSSALEYGRSAPQISEEPIILHLEIAPAMKVTAMSRGLECLIYSMSAHVKIYTFETIFIAHCNVSTLELRELHEAAHCDVSAKRNDKFWYDEHHGRGKLCLAFADDCDNTSILLIQAFPRILFKENQSIRTRLHNFEQAARAVSSQLHLQGVFVVGEKDEELHPAGSTLRGSADQHAFETSKREKGNKSDRGALSAVGKSAWPFAKISRTKKLEKAKKRKNKEDTKAPKSKDKTKKRNKGSKNKDTKGQ